MNKLNFSFYFSFSDFSIDETNPPFVYFTDDDGDYFVNTVFEINFNDKELLEELVSSDDFSELLEDLEDTYGVHDVSGGDSDICGFCSYEVEPTNVKELLSKWQQFFIDNGYTVSVIDYNEDL